MSTRARTRAATAASTLTPPEEKISQSPTKENKPKSSKSTRSTSKSKMSKTNQYCVCRKEDDGSPMVACGSCNDWFHFKCVKLTPREAEDINLYICPSCSEKTGLRTVMLWEGPDAIEPVGPSKTPDIPVEPVKAPSESESDSDQSEDEYVVTKNKRTVRRLSFSSSDSDSKPLPTKKKLQRSKPPSKRQKLSSEDVEDPTRKFCSSKFHEMFRDIFLRYPHIDGVEKTEISEEERNMLINKSAQFAREMEEAVFNNYGESDTHAGPKYKERFRMLQFNLPKVDRVVLQKRIASGQITPQEISQMSSTDLANEETKQSIKIAEKEALEYSILLRPSAPRAKITHKGIEDIEDVSGTRDRENEMEERMENERMARMSAARQRTASLSVPPESPAVHQVPMGWGGPPAINAGNKSFSQPLLYVHAESEQVEPELNLADLINIDDEPAENGAEVNTTDATPLAFTSSVSKTNAEPSSAVSDAHVGISPFASHPSQSIHIPDAAKSSPFSLNTLWSGPNTSHSPTTDVAFKDALAKVESTDVIMEPAEAIEETHDQDFDMFLEDKEAHSKPLYEDFNSTEPVWTGMINMPLDTVSADDTPVEARFVGGRDIQLDSPLWNVLFPSNVLRIEGRVATSSASQFLLQMRMAPTKELLGVAFSHASGTDPQAFEKVNEFLIGKDRYGLVFPWGKSPLEQHPGRELYMIPLPASSPLPEYMELLDGLKLPQTRTSDYMIGIWILNKGKLVVPPPKIAPPPPSASTQPAFQIPSQLASLIPPQVEPAALAAEVAALTPEQIQAMLMSLTGVSGSVPIPQVQKPPQPPPIPMGPPPWPSQAPPYNMGYPQPPPLAGAAPSNGYPLVYPSYDRPDYNNNRGERGAGRQRGWDHDKNDRGRKGSRGKGRGKDVPTRPVDSGWPKKRGGGPGYGDNSSQPRW